MMEVQKYLFEVIKSRISEQYRLVDVIENLLDVSVDSAYRRIRGEKELSFSEVQKICRHFHLSLDEIMNFNPASGVSFQYMPVDLAEQSSYMQYILRLSETLSGLAATKDGELFVTAQDIPFYHFLPHTELLFFKLYVWHDIINRERISFCEFCDRLDRDAIVSVYDKMFRDYMKIPSREIWTNQTPDTILRLLDFYAETGAFDNPETFALLLKQLTALLDTVNTYANSGYKDDKRQTPFLLYLCSVDLENNYMLARRGEHYACTIKLYTVNSVSTDNATLCGETAKWINHLILKSTLISGTASKECFRFFQTSKNKIEELIHKME
ncbi:MAG: hypothetical protein LBJ47_00585 [Tannerella sp.]|jgi:hypothetical protein|nr:hypothetical protein [Tannerella sp.]